MATSPPSSSSTPPNTTVVGDVSKEKDAIRILTNLLQEPPLPTDFDIAILRIDDDHDKDDSPSSSSTSLSSYPQIIKHDVHLAIHAGDLPQVARDFRTAYYQIRTTFQRMEEEIQPKENYNCTNTTTTITRALEQVTKCLLLVCPDHATAWADRKRLFQIHFVPQQQQSQAQESPSSSSMVKLLEQEISFLNLMFTRHSKAPNSWFHRKWILRKLIQCHHDTSTTAVPPPLPTTASSSSSWLLHIIRQEIIICRKVAEGFPKNYYAWTHRMFVLDELLLLGTITTSSLSVSSPSATTTTLKKQEKIQILQEEWNTVEPWLQRHVSDHSAVHYGGQILSKLLHLYLVVDHHDNDNDNNNHSHIHDDCVSKALLLLQKAMESSRRLVELYPTHEVMWIWRRKCSYSFLTTIENIHQQLLLVNDDDTVVSTAMNEYIQKEITSLVKDAMLCGYSHPETPQPSAKENNNVPKEDLSSPKKITHPNTCCNEVHLEMEMTQRYRLSYILWMKFQSERLQGMTAAWISRELNVTPLLWTDLWKKLGSLKCPNNLYQDESIRSLKHALFQPQEP